MSTISQPSPAPDAVKLLQRIVRLRSLFKVVAPENLVALKKQIHESKPSGKEAGIEEPACSITPAPFSSATKTPLPWASSAASWASH